MTPQDPLDRGRITARRIGESLGQVRRLEVALFAICLVLLINGLYQRRQVAKLTGDVAAQHAKAEKHAERASYYGTESRELRKLLPHVRLTREVVLRGDLLEGGRKHLELGNLGHPHLLATIDSKCASCYENLPFLRDLAHEQRCGLSVLGVSLNDSLPANMWHPSITKFDILMGGTDLAWEVLPLGLPSSLILVDAGGRLKGWWLGTLSDGDRSELRDTIEQLCDTRVGVAPGSRQEDR